MQDKKYQIFIGSTYNNLKVERKLIIENILDIGHLPVVMQYPYVTNNRQFEEIKKKIDECDYYVLILGGKYGRIDLNSGLSYTEMEYDYAIWKKIPVLVFPYYDIDDLPLSKKDIDLSNIKNFYDKIEHNKNIWCGYWQNQKSLCKSIIGGLNKCFTVKPRCGWIKGSKHFNAGLLNENNNLKKENDELKLQIIKYKEILLTNTSNVLNIAGQCELNYCLYEYNKYSIHKNYYKISTSWNKILLFVAQRIKTPVSSEDFERIIANFIGLIKGCRVESINIKKDDIQAIKDKFIEQKLISILSTNAKTDTDELICLTINGLSYL